MEYMLKNLHLIYMQYSTKSCVLSLKKFTEGFKKVVHNFKYIKTCTVDICLNKHKIQCCGARGGGAEII